MVKIPLCHHIKSNGTPCQSPSLKHGRYCYYHDRHHNFRIRRTTRRPLPQYDIQLHALKDAESIHFALCLIVTALASGDLESDRASALLYGIQLASSNLNNLAPRLGSRRTGPSISDESLARKNSRAESASIES
jgi:hypothetical protein